MRALLLLAAFLAAATNAPAAKTPAKVFTTTPVYDSVIAAYSRLAATYPGMCRLRTGGLTDIGKPLHLFILSRSGDFTPRDENKTVIFINNGIHPGEPDGIDASIQLSKDLLAEPSKLPESVTLCIIPVYNIDGCLNRGSYSRANQEGPVEYGFRGNAKNLDLNRDFMKCDAANTFALEAMLREWNPDIFVDTHVSDGADYQYVMTLIATQRSKLSPMISGYMDEQVVPALYASMKAKHYEMCPYVETRGETPESGIEGFLETPRFSTGYAALFNCISFVTETHMLKPYNDRVWATYYFFESLLAFAGKNGEEIRRHHRDADYDARKRTRFVLNWQLDTARYETISFKGYEAGHKPSQVSGQPRLYYDRSKPYEKQVRFYNSYKPATIVNAPDYYIIPQAYTEVIARLQLNGVAMKRLTKDTTLTAEVYYIADYQSTRTPYESHYLHSNVQVTVDTQRVRYYKGDYVIETNQACNRYIVEALEPEGGDSFFAWNFFDGILQQKEWFGDYVFEEKADSILKHDPALKAQLEAKRKDDPKFAADGWAQLNFVYQHSGYKEITHNRYPVGRLNGKMELPVE